MSIDGNHADTEWRTDSLNARHDTSIGPDIAAEIEYEAEMVWLRSRGAA